MYFEDHAEEELLMEFCPSKPIADTLPTPLQKRNSDFNMLQRRDIAGDRFIGLNGQTRDAGCFQKQDSHNAIKIMSKFVDCFQHMKIA